MIDCHKCKWKKSMINSRKGKKLPGIGAGKCTRPGGYCMEHLVANNPQNPTTKDMADSCPHCGGIEGEGEAGRCPLCGGP